MFALNVFLGFFIFAFMPKSKNILPENAVRVKDLENLFESSKYKEIDSCSIIQFSTEDTSKYDIKADFNLKFGYYSYDKNSLKELDDFVFLYFKDYFTDKDKYYHVEVKYLFRRKRPNVRYRSFEIKNRALRVNLDVIGLDSMSKQSKNIIESKK
jgi:hypothetical protein